MKKPTFFGKYLLLERINVGGMAEIFIAKSFGVEGFERILAIKKILPTMAEDQEFITMFKDEARISLQLNHANIVRIEELGRYEDNYFLAMEYVAGRDVRTLIERYRRRKQTVPTEQAVFIASRMCEGLDYAHRRKDPRGRELQIVHRDVSPQNILVSYEGEVKLIDFGIAKAANRDQKTQAGILKGKFGYMSPEQVRGQPVDRRSDVFAVGVILYEMLTGEKLFVGESDFSTLEKVRNAEIPPPTQLNPDIPPGLERVLLKALAREPEQRYQWASELQEDLLRFLLAGEVLYSSKLLASFMKETFAEELQREAERMERYASVERPQEFEASGVTATASRSAPRQRVAEPGSPLHAPEASPVSHPDAEDGASAEKTQIFDPTLDEPQLEAPAVRPSDPASVVVAAHSTEAAPSALSDTATQDPTPVPREEGREQAVIGAPAQASAEETVIGRPPPRRAPAPPARVRSDRSRPRTPAPSAAQRNTAAEVAPAAAARAPSARMRALQMTSRTWAALSRPRRLAVLGSVAGLLLLVSGAALLSQRPRTGNLLVLVRPATDAQVLVDGEVVSPNVILSLPLGRHRVSATAPGHAPMERQVDVQESETPPVLELALRPLPEPVPVAAQQVHVAAVTAAPAPPPAARSAAAAAPPPPAVRGAQAPQAAPRAAPTFVALFVGEPGAEVSVDGKPVGRTPEARLANLAVGRRYAFTVTRTGYRPFSGHFRSEGEPQVRVAFQLERDAAPPPAVAKQPGAAPARAAMAPARPAAPAPSRPVSAARGRFACSTQPPGAQVWVDGRNSGRVTPIALGNPLLLPVGPHTVVFKLNGKQSAPASVSVTEESVAKLVNVSLD